MSEDKPDEYQIPDAVRNDDVAMWASEEDLLVYSHFYDKGAASQNATIEELKASVNRKQRVAEDKMIELEAAQAEIQTLKEELARYKFGGIQ